MSEELMLVVKSKIKEVAQDVNVGSDFADALNKEVLALIQKAIHRCKENGRKTLKPQDL